MDNDAFGQLLHSLEKPDDWRMWSELTERERMDYRTRGTEMATAPAHPDVSEREQADG